MKYPISEDDLITLRKAKFDMENLNWTIKVVNIAGNSLEAGVKKIPQKYLQIIQTVTQKALLGIIKTNLLTISKKRKISKPSRNTYKAILTGSGAISGFFGTTSGYGTAIFISEITITTKFLMRTIMDIARSEGEDIYSLEGQLECLQVFALGGQSKDDDGTETSYYVTRSALSSSLKKISASGIKKAINTIVKSVSVLGSNAITVFISKIAARLSILITEKFVAQAVPVIGAIGGGSLNFVFVNHFQKMAKAHFSIRRLERKYGQDIVMIACEEIKTDKI